MAQLPRRTFLRGAVAAAGGAALPRAAVAQQASTSPTVDQALAPFGPGFAANFASDCDVIVHYVTPVQPHTVTESFDDFSEALSFTCAVVGPNNPPQPITSPEVTGRVVTIVNRKNGENRLVVDVDSVTATAIIGGKAVQTVPLSSLQPYSNAAATTTDAAGNTTVLGVVKLWTEARGEVAATATTPAGIDTTVTIATEQTLAIAKSTADLNQPNYSKAVAYNARGVVFGAEAGDESATSTASATSHRRVGTGFFPRHSLLTAIR